jgi:hypothetical protein
MEKPCDSLELNARLRVAARVLSLQTQMQQLEGLLPLCPRCKKIRDDKNRWESVESFITRATEAQFSHGICPSCYETIMKPQLEELKRSRR